jgi:thioredoxin-dependent peroxiredoxin
MALLEVGDKAPAFRTKDHDGRTVKLSDFKGRKVVLYFYPKDDTPGCTTEACGIRDSYAEFERRGVAVLGVSTDSEASHRKFVDKYELPFTLLADTDREIVEAYGVWGEKKLYGRAYMGTQRVTYLIDEKGRIEAVWPKVSPKTHAADILARLDARA